MTRTRTLLLWAAALLPGISAAQMLDPSLLMKPLGEGGWPTYSGDYSGKRYSSLTQLNQSNVKNLTLAWTVRLPAGADGGGGSRGGFGNAIPTSVGGEAAESSGAFGGPPNIRASILEVNGVLY